MLKIVVAHPQQQHSYRLATALKNSGMLGAYCTTVYYRQGNMTSIIARILPPFWKKKAIMRRCQALSDAEVHQFCEGGGLAVLFCHNIPFARRFYDRMRRRVEDRFAEKVARLVARIDADAVVGYDGTSAKLFERVKALSPDTVCIADMSAANALFLRSVYEHDATMCPEYSDSLNGWNRIWDQIDIDRTKRELANADRFLCGSTFVVRSLGFSGIGSERCEVCPYGVDTEAFPFHEKRPKTEHEPLVFIYLGQVSEHKGISYLFESFEKIDPQKARLVCVGAVNLSESITSKLPSNIDLVGRVQHDEVSKLLLSADVLLFPSLGDGFPLSVMEGFASGLPVVCTDNTGTSDCAVEGENGFVVPTQDQEALRVKIEWFIHNRDRIPYMAERARECAMTYTWDAYYTNAVVALRKLVESARHEQY